MKNMSLNQIALACEGTYVGDASQTSLEISGVVIDSRKVEPGFLFVAMKGERTDGHNFIPSVYAKGAACVLCERAPEYPAGPYIQVPSCADALKRLAAYYRSTLSIPIIGISGSVGKTSTKEMIAAVLAQKYHVLKTEGNFNNEIGLPLTIFRIREEHEAAVLEMGISDFGEMTRLGMMARPNICVLTNIGLCHLENLKDRDGILKAKTEMFEFIMGGYVFELRLNVMKTRNWKGLDEVDLDGLKVVRVRKIGNVQRQIIMIPTNNKEFRDYIKRHIKKYNQGEQKAVQDLIKSIERFGTDDVKECLAKFLKKKRYG